MPRLNQLDDVIFPVEEHPVFVSVKTESGERHLSVPEKKAIINAKSNRVLGVVSRGYRLVTNRQALDWAYQCCRTVFPETKAGEWEVKATDAPGTGGHCFLDLVHNSTVLDFSVVPAKERPDNFGPFIRVTNSYNGLRALAFDIGFFRKVCKNGMIAPETIIRFTYTHNQRDIGKAISFDIARDKLAKVQARFAEYLCTLHGCAVSASDFETMVRAALRIKPPAQSKPGSRVAQEWEALGAHVVELCTRYRGELGGTAYAVFNAITEFASHPPDNLCVHRERHSFQRLAGDWLNAFSQECRRPDFALPKYIEKLTKPNGDSRSAEEGTNRP